MHVTIEDVAQRAGVSTATVSRALRGLPSVTPVTRERVLQAAKELSYTVAPQASRLAAGRTMTIGIVVPYADRWFYNKVITNAEILLAKEGYDVLRYSIAKLHSRFDLIERLSSPKYVDGVVIVSVPLTETEVEKLVRSNIAVVTIETVTKFFASVSIDGVLAAEIATQHLIDLGHTRIGIITGGSDNLISVKGSNERKEGYLRVLRKHNLEFCSELEVSGNFSLAGGAEAMAQLLSLQEPPTSVFAFSDEMAIGAMKVARDLGLRIPEDVSVIGFDDHDMSEYVGLTTIKQPVAGYGQTAASLLLDMLSESPQAVTSHVVASTQLIERSSTGICS